MRNVPSQATTAGQEYSNLLVIDDDIRKFILKNADSNQIREMAKRHGMKTLLEDGAEKSKDRCNNS